MERLAPDRHYFAKPVRTLFNDVRYFFPMRSSCACTALRAPCELAAEYVDSQLRQGVTFDGSPPAATPPPARARVPAGAAAGQQVLPVAQAPRRRVIEVAA